MAYYVATPGTVKPPLQPPAQGAPAGIVSLPLPLAAGQYRVINDAGLNVRSSPNTYSDANIVGRLNKLDIIEASAVTGDAFVAVMYQSKKCYCALVHGGVIYLEPVK